MSKKDIYEKYLIGLIENKEAHVGIIGLGLVGLPLAVVFAKAGYKVTGFDIDGKKVSMINNKKSCSLACASDEEIATLVNSGKLRADGDFNSLRSCDVKIIAVPTNITEYTTPQLKAVEKATQSIVQNYDKPSLVVLESTVYPGATEEIVKTGLDKARLKEGKDYWLAYSPSRIDPGNEEWPLDKVPTIVGGLNKASTEMVKTLFNKGVVKVYAASSIMAAEITKLYENSFRIVNIAFVERFRMNCDSLGLDIWEIINLAKTKPYGFSPFYPGPGIGGDCIPTVPMYFAWKIRAHGKRSDFIEMACQTNDAMPYYISNRLSEILNNDRKAIKGSKILIIGIAFKKDIQDTKNTPAEPIIRLLRKKGAEVSYYDPFVPEYISKKGDMKLQSLPLDPQTVKEQDAVVIVTDHSKIDYDLIAKNANLIFDTRNALDGHSGSNIIR